MSILPALVSPIIEAAIEALKDERYKTLKLDLLAAKAQAEMWEEFGRKNAEKAVELARENSELRGQIDTMRQLIEQLRRDISILQKEASNEGYHY